MFLSIIAAIGNQNQIGLNNRIPWNVKDDLEIFKNLTCNHSIIMGRKTFESIETPLKNRKNIIITKNRNFKADGCFIVHSINEAADFCKNDDEVFICGGASIYLEFLKNNSSLLKKMYISHVNYDGEADTFFPDFNKYEWIKKEEISFSRSLKNEHSFNFLTYEKFLK